MHEGGCEVSHCQNLQRVATAAEMGSRGCSFGNEGCFFGLQEKLALQRKAVEMEDELKVRVVSAV